MSHRGPLLTLISGGVLAAVLLVASGQASTTNTTVDNAAQAGAAPTSSAPSQSTGAASAIPSAGGANPSAGTPTPSRPATSRKALFAGRITGGKATVAISVKDGQAVAYLCDGDTMEAWMRGPATGGDLDLKGAPGGERLTGTYGRTKAAGTITAAGRQWRFDAPVVNQPSGLYRATATVRGARVVAGWVVLADGTQVGIATIDGEPEPAPRLDVASGTATVNGDTVTAQPAEPTA